MAAGAGLGDSLWLALGQALAPAQTQGGLGMLGEQWEENEGWCRAERSACACVSAAVQGAGIWVKLQLSWCSGMQGLRDWIYLGLSRNKEKCGARAVPHQILFPFGDGESLG